MLLANGVLIAVDSASGLDGELQVCYAKQMSSLPIELAEGSGSPDRVGVPRLRRCAAREVRNKGVEAVRHMRCADHLHKETAGL
jgi:hypothetical protein